MSEPPVEVAEYETLTADERAAVDAAFARMDTYSLECWHAQRRPHNERGTGCDGHARGAGQRPCVCPCHAAVSCNCSATCPHGAACGGGHSEPDDHWWPTCDAGCFSPTMRIHPLRQGGHILVVSACGHAILGADLGLLTRVGATHRSVCLEGKERQVSERVEWAACRTKATGETPSSLLSPLALVDAGAKALSSHWARGLAAYYRAKGWPDQPIGDASGPAFDVALVVAPVVLRAGATEIRLLAAEYVRAAKPDTAGRVREGAELLEGMAAEIEQAAARLAEGETDV